MYMITGYGQTHFVYHGVRKSPLVVMVHGFLSSSTESFHALFENYKQESSERYRWLMYDLYGCGKSDLLLNSGLKYDLKTYHHQLKSLIDHVQSSSGFSDTDIILFGHSMGCVIAGTFVKQYKAQGMILLTPGGIPSSYYQIVTNPSHAIAKMIHYAGSNPLTQKWAVRGCLKLTLALRHLLRSDPSSRVASMFLSSSSFKTLTSFLDDLNKSFNTIDSEQRLQAVDSQLTHIPMINQNELVFEHFRDLPENFHLKVIFGSNDIISPPSAGKLWHSMVVPHSDLHILEGAIHHLIPTHVKLVQSLIEDTCYRLLPSGD